MRKRVLIALVVVLALAGSASMALADGTTIPPVATGPGSFTDPTPGIADDYTAGKFWLQSGSTWKGDLVVGSGVLWSVQMRGIDVSGLTGPGASGTFVRVGLQESVNWNWVFVQAHLDFYGAGGHLLQSFEGWNVKSSHGFNAGDVPGEFDLRFDIYQAVTGGTWHVTPYFRLEGDADWTTFWDGPWTATAGWDITEGLVYVDIGSTTGAVTYDSISVQPIILMVDDDGVECPQRDYSTISEAMAAASDGVTIEVCAGTYIENVDVNKSVSIISPDRADDTFVQALSTADDVFTITADNVSIDGLTISGAKDIDKGGIRLTGVTGVVISNNVIEYNGNGVYIVQSSGNEVVNNVVRYNASEPPHWDYGNAIIVWSGPSTNNEIINNDIYHNDKFGIFVGGFASVSYAGTEIHGNRLYRNGEYSVFGGGWNWLGMGFMNADGLIKVSGNKIYHTDSGLDYWVSNSPDLLIRGKPTYHGGNPIPPAPDP
jgi:parallel beta-helix repeat protein